VGRNGLTLVETFSNPSIHGCHRIREGVTHVDNYTQSDMLLYTTPDCTVPAGGASIYLDIGGMAEAVKATGPWRSFTFAPE
jgi:hypothetical protein